MCVLGFVTLVWALSYAVAAAAQDMPSLVLEHLSMVVAALSYAKLELLWYFRHIDEMLPAALPGNDEVEPNSITML